MGLNRPSDVQMEFVAPLVYTATEEAELVVTGDLEVSWTSSSLTGATVNVGSFTATGTGSCPSTDLSPVSLHLSTCTSTTSTSMAFRPSGRLWSTSTHRNCVTTVDR